MSDRDQFGAPRQPGQADHSSLSAKHLSQPAPPRDQAVADAASTIGQNAAPASIAPVSDAEATAVRPASIGSKPPLVANASADRHQQTQTPRKASTGSRAQNRSHRHDGERAETPIYAALDLGTNNCRLLVARPSRRGFVVMDSFSRIIRLGEGLTTTGALSDAAMARTIQALRICGAKMRRNGVDRARLVATQACRMASNGAQFVERVSRQTGLSLEVLSQESEAQLAVAGCATLLDRDSDMALVFDIGGGSSELVWLDLSGDGTGPSIGNRGALSEARMMAWTSLPVGVVTLAERFDGREVTPESFEAMVADVLKMLEPFEAKHQIAEKLKSGRLHFLGTSGTVTTVAGIRLELPRYDRRQVDGCWLATSEVREVTTRLLMQSYEQRCAEPCIGRERADLVLAGCAILEALLRLWPTERLRVADRGLREGILSTLMAEDGYPRSSRRRARRRGRSG